MKIQEYDKEVSQLLTKAKAGDDRDWIERGGYLNVSLAPISASLVLFGV